MERVFLHAMRLFKKAEMIWVISLVVCFPLTILLFIVTTIISLCLFSDPVEEKNR